MPRPCEHVLILQIAENAAKRPQSTSDFRLIGRQKRRCRNEFVRCTCYLASASSVYIPAELIIELEHYLETIDPSPTAWLFPSSRKGVCRCPQTFEQLHVWRLQPAHALFEYPMTLTNKDHYRQAVVASRCPPIQFNTGTNDHPASPDPITALTEGGGGLNAAAK